MCAGTGKAYTVCPCENCARARAFNALNAGRFRSPPPAPARASCPPATTAPRRERVAKKCPGASGEVGTDRRLPAEREFDDNSWQPPQSVAPQKSPPDGAVTAREFGQEEFQASGAAASQNEKLLEFFRKPQNFGLWFKATFLEELSGATRMNNRAVDLRKVLQCDGLYIDNFMIKPTESSAVSSHYRICKIADALCLSATKKQELLAGSTSGETHHD